MNPHETIVPVFGMGAGPQQLTFLGSGSIVGDGTILLTADHVTRDYQGQLVTSRVDDLSARHALTLIERDEAHDLALYRIAGYQAQHPLVPVFDEPVSYNLDLLTFEYGTTRTVEGGRIQISPATRVGHLTRMLDATDVIGPAGIDALELSFPALRGASGAPVLCDGLGVNGFGIVGVIVASASYHLLPAQIESVIDVDNNYAEEIRYLLPQALAVNVRHLRPMYERAISS